MIVVKSIITKKEDGINKAILKKINDHFGFEDEEGEWFADTPIALTMANDEEFSEMCSCSRYDVWHHIVCKCGSWCG